MTTYTHCQRPGCGKKKTIPARVPKRGSSGGKVTPGAYVDARIYESDPYCSRDCCEADHHIADVLPSLKRRPATT